jgi:hypothetical protein
MQQQRRRSGIILGLVALGLLAGVALTASPTQAVDAPGPYYALPSWDQQLIVVNRFVVLTNWGSKAVLDKETGLVWEQSPQTGTASWSTARVTCINKNVGGRKGWRLPAIPELTSLVDPTNPDGNPDLPVGHPFTNVQSDNYWSASTVREFPTTAWAVPFTGGFVGHTSKSLPHRIWCVRGGMQADAY